MNLGNVTGIDLVTFGTGKTWSAVNTVSTSAQTVSVPGVRLGDMILVTKPTEQTGVSVTGARVSAADTVTVIFSNPTAGNLTPTAEEEYSAVVLRSSLPLNDAVTI